MNPTTSSHATYREYDTRSMLKKKTFTDSWFLCSNGGSPYRGCEHGCVYCDGRSERYGLPLFDSEIQVKRNAPDILDRDLSRLCHAQTTLLDYENPRVPWQTFYGGSGTSDWYQPAERKYRLASRMIEKYVKHEIPLHIMTKSALVVRDIHSLQRLPWCTVSFSFSCVDDALACLLEPKASLPSARLDAMRILDGNGISTGASYMPIVPFLCDSKEAIERTVHAIRDAGGTYATPGVMTLRRDREESFFDFLGSHFPDVLPRFRELYVNGYTPKADYAREIYRRVLSSCFDNSVAPYMPRFIPESPLKRNREVSTILHRISFLLDLREGPSKKSRAFTYAANNIDGLDKDILELYRAKRLSDIRGVGHYIGAVIEEILLQGKSSLLARLERP